MTDAEKVELLRGVLQEVLDSPVGPEDEPVDDMIDVDVVRKAEKILKDTK